MTEPIDYAGAWKETLERYLHPFLELCFPVAASDSSTGPRDNKTTDQGDEGLLVRIRIASGPQKG
jgi:hypothetical protein